MISTPQPYACGVMTVTWFSLSSYQHRKNDRHA